MTPDAVREAVARAEKNTRMYRKHSFRQITYGEQMDATQREVDRLGEVVKLHPQRAQEIEQGREIITKMSAQMRRLGKRRSSCFYGLEEISA